MRELVPPLQQPTIFQPAGNPAAQDHPEEDFLRHLQSNLPKGVRPAFIEPRTGYALLDAWAKQDLISKGNNVWHLWVLRPDGTYRRICYRNGATPKAFRLNPLGRRCQRCQRFLQGESPAFGRMGNPLWPHHVRPDDPTQAVPTSHGFRQRFPGTRIHLPIGAQGGPQSVFTIQDVSVWPVPSGTWYLNPWGYAQRTPDTHHTRTRDESWAWTYVDTLQPLGGIP